MDRNRVIEILRLVIDKLDSSDRDDTISGICYCISSLYHSNIITLQEKIFVMNVVNNNKPDKFIFTKYTEGKYWTDNVFWWITVSREKETAKVRANYIRDLIRIL